MKQQPALHHCIPQHMRPVASAPRPSCLQVNASSPYLASPQLAKWSRHMQTTAEGPRSTCPQVNSVELLCVIYALPVTHTASTYNDPQLSTSSSCNPRRSLINPVLLRQFYAKRSAQCPNGFEKANPPPTRQPRLPPKWQSFPTHTPPRKLASLIMT
ncbi:hypothetical protein EJ06DRAFT_321828 [Trichodelitschia bisporula]|uniref:Uncharacterized protein n=1 Tax=Trichodelitschia bisporula TaxID=703511 RepID=A0A6G1I4W9_9PEZI|nr:hypothetical protein EJ06DRAFT_321828 [Trichodelitschia bisporula]